MKKLAVVLVLAAACHSAGGPTAGTVRPAGSPISGGGVGGAISPRTAVTGFLAAARAEDLQALASMWGTSEGPARNSIPRDELEKREIVMICFLKHDRYRLLTDAESTSGQRRIQVELTLGTLTRTTAFTVVPTERGRWYVQAFDMEALRDVCAKR